jgi:hypothetical protein
MSRHADLIEQYRTSRTGATDHRLTNSICVAADLLLKIEAGYYTPEQTDDAWGMIEALIGRYAEGRRDEKGK